ncbi:hypothetical protein SKAU_G00135100 [Synaphobranchus kaupii]|uniref:Uncharacterized protein n=1 Tax=Synaphobranchus kaupii TaxID=118154 RepID=A0A9Q1FRK8_SYNKA|nr:hypothetical protein SKAU_G00135100 [Synaphobranchus kaupii]
MAQLQPVPAGVWSWREEAGPNPTAFHRRGHESTNSGSVNVTLGRGMHSARLLPWNRRAGFAHRIHATAPSPGYRATAGESHAVPPCHLSAAVARLWFKCLLHHVCLTA